MRRNIDLISNLAEGVAYQDHNFVILQNPSVAEIKALRSKAVAPKSKDGLRAILTATDLFVWNGYWMTHRDAALQLGIGDHVDMHLKNRSVEWDVDAFDGNWDTEGPMADRMRAQHAMIVTHPTLLRLYGGKIVVVGTDYVQGPDRPFDLYDTHGGGRGYEFFYDADDNLRR